MSDALLKPIEQKLTLLVAELEVLRKEVLRLRQENSQLKAEKNANTAQLQALIELFPQEEEALV